MRATAAVVLSAVVLAGCTADRVDGNGSVPGGSRTTSARPTPVASTSAASTSASPQKTAVSVHVSVNISDGATVGVGMPYIAIFNQTITDARAFQDATKVTVNGAEVDARWYFEYADASSGHPMEAHLRMEHYWPANARIHVDLPVKGHTGGAVAHHPNSVYRFDNSLTSDFATGDAHRVVVSNAQHQLTVYNNGSVWKTFPVSLGATKTQTRRGIKVVMEKLPTVCMHDIAGNYHECGIKDDQRLTYDGEYLHAAPWNCTSGPGCTGPYNNIGSANSSNGCTNLRPADAKTLYDFLGIGDPVEFPDADGKRMQLGDGYGDWNVTWSLWQTGGAIKTS